MQQFDTHRELSGEQLLTYPDVLVEGDFVSLRTHDMARKGWVMSITHRYRKVATHPIVWFRPTKQRSEGIRIKLPKMHLTDDLGPIFKHLLSPDQRVQLFCKAICSKPRVDPFSALEQDTQERLAYLHTRPSIEVSEGVPLAVREEDLDTAIDLLHATMQSRYGDKSSKYSSLQWRGWMDAVLDSPMWPDDEDRASPN